MKLEAIEKEIIENVKESILDNWEKDGATNWTVAMKESLALLGKKNKYKVYTTLGKSRRQDKFAGGHEWLWDLCWSDEGKSLRDFRKLPLIVEIEWGNKGEIISDFQKLTVGIADNRLMIFYYDEEKGKRNENWVKEVINDMEKCPSAKGQRIILIAVPSNDKDKILSYILENGKTIKTE